MAEKPDYYAVLGVAKTASLDEIKAAFKKIVMKCHPDMLRNKSEAEKKEAETKFQLAKEAQEVLTDTAKRATYDKYGHRGLENLGNSGGGKSQSYTDAAGPVTRKVYSEEDTFSFFGKKSAAEKKDSGVGSDGLTSEERRNKAREERMKNRGGGGSTPAPANNTPAPSVQDTFKDVADKVGKAASSLNNAAVPLDVLERFRDNLKDFLKEIDAAIDRARKNGGPQF